MSAGVTVGGADRSAIEVPAAAGAAGTRHATTHSGTSHDLIINTSPCLDP
jgi:hypothetical protein